MCCVPPRFVPLESAVGPRQRTDGSDRRRPLATRHGEPHAAAPGLLTVRRVHISGMPCEAASVAAVVSFLARPRLRGSDGILPRGRVQGKSEGFFGSDLGGIASTCRRCKFLGRAEQPPQDWAREASHLVRRDRALALGGRSGRSTFRFRARAAIPGGANMVRPRIPDRYMTG